MLPYWRRSLFLGVMDTIRIVRTYSIAPSTSLFHLNRSRIEVRYLLLGTLSCRNRRDRCPRHAPATRPGSSEGRSDTCYLLRYINSTFRKSQVTVCFDTGKEHSLLSQ